MDHLYVNTTRSNRLKVNFDLSFPEIPCNLLALGAVDDTGVPQKDAVYEIYKHKLTPMGQKEGAPEPHKVGDTLLSEEQLKQLTAEQAERLKLINEQKVECGNCYGAGSPGQCCNTCEEVRQAYDRIGWRFKPTGITQCASETYLSNLKDQFAEDGGCQIYGQLELNKAAGHFHIAPHKKLHEGGMQAGGGIINIMDLISFTFDQFNITHTVNSLRFGDQFPGINSPLDGQMRKLQDTHGMYQYYIKVVPTIYKSLDGKEIESNQYAVTEHMRHLSPGSGRGLPGVYFNYELSPIQAVYEERQGGGWLRFITSACAIVGGSFTVMGLVDGILIYFSKCFGGGGILGR